MFENVALHLFIDNLALVCLLMFMLIAKSIPDFVYDDIKIAIHLHLVHLFGISCQLSSSYASSVLAYINVLYKVLLTFLVLKHSFV